MLKQRIITACVLTIALIGAVFLPAIGFALSMAVVVVLGAWEWANLSSIEQTWVKTGYVLLTLLVLAGITKLPLNYVLLTAVGCWLLLTAAICTYPQSARYWRHFVWRGLMGLIVLPSMWLSFVFIHELPNGAWLILLLWAIVALADIGAYFVGHAIGRKKLAPLVSPNKTQEGAYGGLLSAGLLIFLASFFYHQSFEQSILCALVAVIVAVASIVGDLLESMLKRFRGIKDSGQLLPGHGGVLDRIDGWIAAAPVYALFILYFNVMVI